MKKVYSFYSICLALIALGCFKSTHLHIDSIGYEHLLQEPLIAQETPKETWIIVFVHGIVGIKPHLNLGNVVRLVCDDVSDTEYALAVELTRGDPFFSLLQPIAEIGLIPVDKTRKDPHAPTALAEIMDSIERLVDPTVHIQNDYYTFGWSGLATHSARVEAGKQLYYALEKLIKQYRSQNINPKIRVIGYSHGGNVILNLGSVMPLDYKEHSFLIDELILLGTPILCESDFCINSKLFKEVIHIYSRGDRVQLIDCLSYKRFFSNKTFSARPKFSLPKKLKQIQLRFTEKIKMRSKTHAIDARIKKADNPAVITGSARFLRDRSPGHLELWYFGWLPHGYRENHILYPLPACALLPFILKAAKTYGPIEPQESLIVDARPRYEHLIVRKEYDISNRILMPFLSFDQIKEWNEKLACYRPKHITVDMQDDHVYRWCDIAQKEFKKRRKKRKKRKRRHRTARVDVLELL